MDKDADAHTTLRAIDTAFKAWMHECPSFYTTLFRHVALKEGAFAGVLAKWKAWMGACVRYLCVDSKDVAGPRFDALSARIIELAGQRSPTKTHLVLLEAALQQQIALQQIILQNNVVLRPPCIHLTTTTTSTSTLITAGTAMSVTARATPVTEKEWSLKYTTQQTALESAFAQEMHTEMKAVAGKAAAPSLPPAPVTAPAPSKDATQGWHDLAFRLAGLHSLDALYVKQMCMFRDRTMTTATAVTTRLAVHFLQLFFAWPHFDWSPRAQAFLLPFLTLFACAARPSENEMSQWLYTCMDRNLPVCSFFRHLFAAWEERELIPRHLADVHQLPEAAMATFKELDIKAMSALEPTPVIQAAHLFMRKLLPSPEFIAKFSPELLDWAWAPRLKRISVYDAKEHDLSTTMGRLTHTYFCAFLSGVLGACTGRDAPAAAVGYAEYTKEVYRTYAVEWERKAVLDSVAVVCSH